MSLMLMGHQQKFLFLQSLEQSASHSRIVRYPRIDTVITGLFYPMGEDGNVYVFVPP